MLKKSIDAYVALRRAMGLRIEDPEYLLRSFASWASERGETHVRSQTVMEWAASKGSAWRRERKLRVVAAFARHAVAEDPRHEVPPIHVFSHKTVLVTPHIYSDDEVVRLMRAAEQLPPTWRMRPHTAATLFGLLASTGLRLSEALSLRLGDFTADGLVIRHTKFNKSRLVPIHPSTVSALDCFLARRRRARVSGDYLFASPRGGRISRKTVSTWFYRLARGIGLRGAPGTRGPRIHDLRHTFAVRSLETAPLCGAVVGAHVRALSTYLGHSRVAHTCSYLQTTPRLMRGIADACERLIEGGQQ